MFILIFHIRIIVHRNSSALITLMYFMFSFIYYLGTYMVNSFHKVFLFLMSYCLLFNEAKNCFNNVYVVIKH